jgi:hypothetical protein
MYALWLRIERRVRVQLEVLYIIACRCDRIAHELQGFYTGEFSQSMFLVLVLTDLKEHATCQYRVKEALQTGEIWVINTDYNTICQIYRNAQ